MKRWSIIPILVAAFPFAVAAQSFGDLFSSDLVHWSYMQEPQQPESRPRQQPTPTPTPEPTPETQPAQNPTTSSPAEHTPGQPSPNSAANSQYPTAQTFVGVISKDADSYTLKVSANTSYKLDNQQQVQEYEGQRVRVTGTLDSSINLIHVDKIEPLS